MTRTFLRMNLTRAARGAELVVNLAAHRRRDAEELGEVVQVARFALGVPGNREQGECVDVLLPTPGDR